MRAAAAVLGSLAAYPLLPRQSSVISPAYGQSLPQRPIIKCARILNPKTASKSWVRRAENRVRALGTQYGALHFRTRLNRKPGLEPGRVGRFNQIPNTSGPA